MRPAAWRPRRLVNAAALTVAAVSGLLTLAACGGPGTPSHDHGRVVAHLTIPFQPPVTTGNPDIIPPRHWAMPVRDHGGVRHHSSLILTTRAPGLTGPPPVPHRWDLQPAHRDQLLRQLAPIRADPPHGRAGRSPWGSR